MDLSFRHPPVRGAPGGGAATAHRVRRRRLRCWRVACGAGLRPRDGPVDRRPPDRHLCLAGHASRRAPIAGGGPGATDTCRARNRWAGRIADAGLSSAQRRLAETLDERNRQIGWLADMVRAAPITEDAGAVARSMAVAASRLTEDPTWFLAVLGTADADTLAPGVYRRGSGRRASAACPKSTAGHLLLSEPMVRPRPERGMPLGRGARSWWSTSPRARTSVRC